MTGMGRRWSPLSILRRDWHDSCNWNSDQNWELQNGVIFSPRLAADLAIIRRLAYSR